MAAVAPVGTVELDPTFIKALRLLHSRSSDSTAQLRKMVDDAIAARKGNAGKKLVVLEEPAQPAVSIAKSAASSSKIAYPAKPDFDDLKKQEGEKYLQKVKQELTEPSQTSEQKRANIFDVAESMTRKEEDEVRRKEKLLEKSPKKEPKPISDSDSTDESELGMDADDFAVDMGIACVVCRQFDVSNGNQLVECQECHNLYHQDCHSPKVSSSDLNDPRFVWYCSKCTKIMKKIVAKPQKTKSPQPTIMAQPNFPKDTPASSKPVAPAPSTTKAPTEQVFAPFRRIDTSKSSIRDSSGRPLAGLAGMAANLSGKSEIKPGMRNSEIQKIQKANEAVKKALELQQLKDAKIDFSKSKSDLKAKSKQFVVPKAGTSKPSSAPVLPSSSSCSSSGASPIAGPSASAAHADKRLQLMKKKAAAKLDAKKLR